MESVQLIKTDGVGVLLLNSPKTKNALKSEDMLLIKDILPIDFTCFLPRNLAVIAINKLADITPISTIDSQTSHNRLSYRISWIDYRDIQMNKGTSRWIL